jgi:hypothetical protein
MLLTTTAESPRRAVVQRPTSALGLSRHFGGRPITSGLPLETDIVKAGRHVSKVPILLQNSFWGGERKILEPLMRFTRGDVRDHIVSSKIDHGPP